MVGPGARALERERIRNGRILAALRLAAVAPVFALSLYLGVAARLADWRATLPLFSAYLAAALAIFVAGRRFPSLSRWLGLAVALVDVPVVYRLQSVSLPLSPSPGGWPASPSGSSARCSRSPRCRSSAR